MSDKKLETLFHKALSKAKRTALGYTTPKKAPGHSERLRAAREAMAEARKINISRFGSARAAKKAYTSSGKATPATKAIKLALVNGTWYQPDKVFTDPQAYEPKKAWFFGIGNGYSITGIMVKSDSHEAAIEAAENKYPHHFFTKLLTPKQFQKLEDNPGDGWEENPEHYRFIEDVGKYGLPEEDIRINAKVETYVPNAVKVDEFSREAVLPDGRTVEYV